MNQAQNKKTANAAPKNASENKAPNKNQKPKDTNPNHNRAAAHGPVKLDKDSLKTFKRLLGYFGKENIARLVAVLCCILIASLTSVKASTFVGVLIDDYISPLLGNLNPDFAPLLNQLKILACIYIAGIIANFLQQLLMVRVTNGVLYKIRETLFGHMQTLPISYFDQHQYGDIMSRYTNDVDSVRQLLSDSITEVSSSFITIAVVMISMLKISWQLTLIVIGTVILMYLVTIFVGGNSAKYFKEGQIALGNLNAYIEEMLNGQKVVKVFCHEEKNKEKFNEKNNTLYGKALRANIFASIIMPINVNLGNVQYVILAVAGASWILGGKLNLTLGLLASFLTLSKSINRPLSMISQQINSFVMALAGAGRIFEVLDTPSETDEGYVTLVKAEKAEDGSLVETESEDGIWAWKHTHKSTGETEYTELKGDVVLDGVDFSYVPGKQILYDVSLFAKPGQKIAFVGSTGAGKTTITNLLNRFYDIEDGRIKFDGININKIKKADLRHSLGIVLQDTNLFTGTIADNIRFGKLDATMEEIEAAAKLANADSFIEKLPDGYNTVINGTASQLSQGQCQLLAIARCAIANPPVMILDEATSSVDTRTEILIQNGMDALMNGRTTFVIAHRLSTIQNANAIMVVEGGHIIERGNHDELISQQGRYYQLYTGNAQKAK